MNVKEWLAKAENILTTQIPGHSQFSDAQKDQFRVSKASYEKSIFTRGVNSVKIY